MSEKSSATTDKAGTDGGFNSDVQRLGQYVGQLHDDLAGIAKSAGDTAQSGTAAAREEGRKTLEEAKDKSERATTSLRDGMAENLVKTLGIAVGIGILIGLLGPAIVRLRRRSS